MEHLLQNFYEVYCKIYHPPPTEAPPDLLRNTVTIYATVYNICNTKIKQNTEFDKRVFVKEKLC